MRAETVTGTILNMIDDGGCLVGDAFRKGWMAGVGEFYAGSGKRVATNRDDGTFPQEKIERSFQREHHDPISWG